MATNFAYNHPKLEFLKTNYSRKNELKFIYSNVTNVKNQTESIGVRINQIYRIKNDELHECNQLHIISSNIHTIGFIRSPTIFSQILAINLSRRVVEEYPDKFDFAVIKKLSILRNDKYKIADYIIELRKLLDTIDIKRYHKKYIDMMFKRWFRVKDIVDNEVKENPSLIQYITNPPKELQVLAVSKDLSSIQYIKNPSEHLQKLVITKNPSSIQYITEPTEYIQVLAVSKDLSSIQYIKNPTLKTLLAAIGLADVNNFTALYEQLYEIINNLSLDKQCMFVRYHPKAIIYIRNQTKEIQLAAVKSNGIAIKYIKNPCHYDVYVTAIRNSKNAINYINQESIQPSIFNRLNKLHHQIWSKYYIPYNISKVNS